MMIRFGMQITTALLSMILGVSALKGKGTHRKKNATDI